LNRKAIYLRSIICHVKETNTAFARGWKTLLADLSAVMAMDFSFAYLFKSLDGDYCFPSESILLGYGLIKLGG